MTGGWKVRVRVRVRSGFGSETHTVEFEPSNRYSWRSGACLQAKSTF